MEEELRRLSLGGAPASPIGDGRAAGLNLLHMLQAGGADALAPAGGGPSARWDAAAPAGGAAVGGGPPPPAPTQQQQQQPYSALVSGPMPAPAPSLFSGGAGVWGGGGALPSPLPPPQGGPWDLRPAAVGGPNQLAGLPFPMPPPLQQTQQQQLQQQIHQLQMQMMWEQQQLQQQQQQRPPPPGFLSPGVRPPPPGFGGPPPPQQQQQAPPPPPQQQQPEPPAPQPALGTPAGAAPAPRPAPPAAAGSPAQQQDIFQLLGLAPAAGGGGAPPSAERPAFQKQKREGRWVDVMDRRHDGRPPRADPSSLDAELGALAARLLATPEERAAWRAAFDAVSAALRTRWPEGRVHLFGSAANGLAVRASNDIDVTLELPGLPAAERGGVVEAMGELLAAAGMADVLPLPRARVPVAKFTVPSSGTKVDVTVNNLLALENTRLLAVYSAVDGRLPALVALVKHWAKQRAVNDPYRGTLSSYCYVLMCIHCLQRRSPPVLPCLQDAAALPPTRRRALPRPTAAADGADALVDAAYFDRAGDLAGFGAPNTEGLGSLLWAFFEYWAWGHDYRRSVASIRVPGGLLSKEDKGWTQRVGSERHLVCVEDPFETGHDLGRTADRASAEVLRKEFLRAATLLRDAADPLAELFEPFRAAGARGAPAPRGGGAGGGARRG